MSISGKKKVKYHNIVNNLCFLVLLFDILSIIQIWKFCITVPFQKKKKKNQEISKLNI